METASNRRDRLVDESHCGVLKTHFDKLPVIVQ